MQQVQINTIIRDRGQMTIPREIREKKSWLSAGSVVTIILVSRYKIVITPYKKFQTPGKS